MSKRAGVAKEVQWEIGHQIQESGDSEGRWVVIYRGTVEAAIQ